MLPFAGVPVALVAVALVALVYAAYLAATEPTTASPSVAVAGGLVALVALIFNAWFAARQNRIRYTLDLYFARYSNATYNERANIFYERRALISASQSETELRNVQGAPEDGKLPPGIETAQSTLYMLNYWETLATAYIEHHLDRDTFKNISKDIVVMVVERSKNLIGEKRREDREYFENLASLFWTFSDAETKKRCIPRLGPPPSLLPDKEQTMWAQLQTETPLPSVSGTYARRMRLRKRQLAKGSSGR